MRQTLLGGNQLTAARARCAFKGKLNAQTPEKALAGIVLVIEDWYTKASFLRMSYLNNASLYSNAFIMFRLYGNTITHQSQHLNMYFISRVHNIKREESVLKYYSKTLISLGYHINM